MKWRGGLILFIGVFQVSSLFSQDETSSENAELKAIQEQRKIEEEKTKILEEQTKQRKAEWNASMVGLPESRTEIKTPENYITTQGTFAEGDVLMYRLASEQTKTLATEIYDSPKVCAETTRILVVPTNFSLSILDKREQFLTSVRTQKEYFSNLSREITKVVDPQPEDIFSQIAIKDFQGIQQVNLDQLKPQKLFAAGALIGEVAGIAQATAQTLHEMAAIVAMFKTKTAMSGDNTRTIDQDALMAAFVHSVDELQMARKNLAGINGHIPKKSDLTLSVKYRNPGFSVYSSRIMGRDSAVAIASTSEKPQTVAEAVTILDVILNESLGLSGKLDALIEATNLGITEGKAALEKAPADQKKSIQDNIQSASKMLTKLNELKKTLTGYQARIQGIYDSIFTAKDGLAPIDNLYFAQRLVERIGIGKQTLLLELRCIKAGASQKTTDSFFAGSKFSVGSGVVLGYLAYYSDGKIALSNLPANYAGYFELKDESGNLPGNLSLQPPVKRGPLRIRGSKN